MFGLSRQFKALRQVCKRVSRRTCSSTVVQQRLFTTTPTHPSLLQGLPSDLPESVPATKLVDFSGKFLLLGLGSIGSGTLPLLLKHINMNAAQITVLAGPDSAPEIAALKSTHPEIATTVAELTVDNYSTLLDSTGVTGEGDFILNLTVDVGSCDLMQWCNSRGVNYVDTVVEPWAGRYIDPTLSSADRCNYTLREEALALKQQFGSNAPTAVITHGANPGMVSHFVKQALLNLSGVEDQAIPVDRADWAALAQQVGVKAVHIAERDTQVQAVPKEAGQFVNTWSVDGFISEGCQPGELGWGTHEKHLPAKGKEHTTGCKSAIYIERPGASLRVRTWTPTEGSFNGWLITHNESISLSDYFTVKDADTGEVVYRPTTHYAYHPCDDAVLSLLEMQGKNWVEQKNKKLIVDEIISGIDELGVLLMGTDPETGKHFAYWYGSQLEISQARKLIPKNSATSLQVTAGALAAVVYAMRNPKLGILEPEEVPHHEILDVMAPYIAPVVGVHTDWTPLQNRHTLFQEDVDETDPWQFKNVLVE